MVKTRLLALTSALAFAVFGCGPVADNPPTVVDDLDVDRYLGTWYDIASIPLAFSEGCHCTTATYGLLDNGDIEVVNRCNEDSVDGPLSVANGRAFIPDAAAPSKLRVEFFPIVGQGDYWVVDLWEGNQLSDPYTLAVVSDPTRETLWILARTPTLPEGTFNAMVDDLEARGFDIARLERVEQAGCEYPYLD